VRAVQAGSAGESTRISPSRLRRPGVPDSSAMSNGIDWRCSDRRYDVFMCVPLGPNFPAHDKRSQICPVRYFIATENKTSSNDCHFFG
jgi:hypothetical protein